MLVPENFHTGILLQSITRSLRYVQGHAGTVACERMAGTILFLQRRGEKITAAKHFANSLGEVARQSPLCHVATSTRRERRRNVLRLFVDCKKEDLGTRMNVTNARSDLQPVHHGHRYIEHENVRIEKENCMDCFLSILRGAGDFKFSAQFISKVCEHGLVIVNKENTNCAHNSSSRARGAHRVGLASEDRPYRGFGTCLF
jgi:hypothetical protein